MIEVGVKIIIINAEGLEKLIAVLGEEKSLHKGYSLRTVDQKRVEGTKKSLIRQDTMKVIQVSFAME